jgi:hypothetical protein
LTSTCGDRVYVLWHQEGNPEGRQDDHWYRLADFQVQCGGANIDASKKTRTVEFATLALRSISTGDTPEPIGEETKPATKSVDRPTRALYCGFQNIQEARLLITTFRLICAVLVVLSSSLKFLSLRAGAFIF